MDKKLTGSEGRTFRRLEGGYAIDAHQVYYGKEMITGAVASHFEIVNEKSGISRDGTYYYKRATKLPVKDYQTFIHLKGEFWKDRYQVYSVSNPIDPGHLFIR
ncbi:DKNYY domain-containing protein [Pedobacter sp. MC2016-24]|uniref:DKNYY domain-containing protein n=1 Tax=Pedobacter sp. MC2016-24 TaxID=2780090 RepID=UPI00187E0C5A|nr:DKNYY domain-containing protein [Pedobacter sp. MC2016-24]MBE9601471.1 DKNYY domain-containing protein [Pedobacter sp. MC2016-24]